MLNKWQIIGNLGTEPDSRVLEDGTVVTNLSVATARYWTDADGDKQAATEWIQVVTFGRLAENCGKYLTTGRQVYVEGRYQLDIHDRDDGTTGYYPKLIAHQVIFLGGNPENRLFDEAANNPAAEPEREPRRKKATQKSRR